MGYAPVAAIATPPDPADSGTSLVVEKDTGPRFPTPPFMALIWPTNTIPTFGVDSEEVMVTEIDHDTFTIVRAAEPIEIQTGRAIACLGEIPTYDLNDTFVAEEIRDSQGFLRDGGTITLDVAGIWTYQNEDEPVRHIFVEYGV